VVKAYVQLSAEGYIEMVPGSGTYVKGDLQIGDASGQISKYSPCLMPDPARLSSTARHLMEIDFGDLAFLPQTFIQEYSSGLLPIKLWSATIAQQYRRLGNECNSGRQEAFGYRPLREAVASYLTRSRAVRCTAEQIIIFSGPQHALHFIALLLMKPGEPVVLENPGYRPSDRIFQARGAKMITINVDEDGLCINDLERVKTPCTLICTSLSHHVPTGTSLTVERRRKLLEWAKQSGSWIVEDAWDSDYNHGGSALPALQGMDTTGSVFYVYSFARLLYPMISTGVLVVPEGFIELFARAKNLFDSELPLIEQATLAEFIERGHLEQHLRKTRAVYRERRQTLIFNLVRKLHQNIRICTYSAGLHQLVRFVPSLSEGQIRKASDQAGLPMTSTNQFYTNGAPAAEFIIHFSHLENEKIPQIVERFAAALPLEQQGRLAQQDQLERLARNASCVTYTTSIRQHVS
jgi:GntR family transcriptional regulator/MocR family aminotransferase